MKGAALPKKPSGGYLCVCVSVCVHKGNCQHHLGETPIIKGDFWTQEWEQPKQNLMGKCMHGLHSLHPLFCTSSPFRWISSVLFQWICVWMTWLAIISLPFLHIWVGSWLDTCVLSAIGAGEVESVVGDSSSIPKAATRAPEPFLGGGTWADR